MVQWSHNKANESYGIKSVSNNQMKRWHTKYSEKYDRDRKGGGEGEEILSNEWTSLCRPQIISFVCECCFFEHCNYYTSRMLISWWLCLHLIWCWKPKGKQINENLCIRCCCFLLLLLFLYFLFCVCVFTSKFTPTQCGVQKQCIIIIEDSRFKMLFDYFFSLFSWLSVWVIGDKHLTT